LCGGADRSDSFKLSMVVEFAAALSEEPCHKSMWGRGEVPFFLNLDIGCRVNFVPVARCTRDLVGRSSDVDGSEESPLGIQSGFSLIQTLR